MNTKKIMWIQWAIFAALIIGFLQYKSCNARKLQVAESAVDSLKLANQTLDSVKNKREQTIYTQIAILTSNQQSIKELSDSIFNLKNRDAKILKEVIAYYKAHINTVIDSVIVPYTDTVVIQPTADNTIAVPKTASLSSPYFSIDETIGKQSVLINHLEIPDSEYIRIVENRGGFLRKVNGKLKFHVPTQIQFQTLHTNPYVHVTGQNSVVYTPKAKSRWLLNGLLLGLGVFLGTKL